MLKFYVENVVTGQVGEYSYCTTKEIIEVVADVPELEKALKTKLGGLASNVSLHSVMVLEK